MVFLQDGLKDEVNGREHHGPPSRRKVCKQASLPSNFTYNVRPPSPHDPYSRRFHTPVETEYENGMCEERFGVWKEVERMQYTILKIHLIHIYFACFCYI